MFVVTAQQIRRAEEAVFAFGIPEAALMESAGRHVAETAAELLARGGNVVVACGPGHNGGDGLVAARYLSNRGFRVDVLLTRHVHLLSPLLQALLAPLGSMGVRVHIVDSEDTASLHNARELMGRSDLIIDALLGIGASGPPRGSVADLVRLIVEAGRPVLAVDIPSGVDADTGAVYDPVVTAQTTVCMGMPKFGHLLHPGAAYCGRLQVVDVGIPRYMVEAVAEAEWMTPSKAGSLFPPRPSDSHKGLFGRCLVIAGSRGMPGAAVLAVQAALRSGTGLTSWAGPDAVLPAVATHAPEATLFPLEEAHFLTEKAVEQALSVSEGRAVALGPGLGLKEETGRFVHSFLERFDGPVVVDADALTHLGVLGRWPNGKDVERVLTPHPKELARLVGCALDDVLRDRVRAVRAAAQRYRAVVLLKGVPSLVAEPSGWLYVCPVGNPVLAVGGSGDVLTGLIGGLLAQGVPAVRSAVLGAFWHGTAADLLAETGGTAGYVAGDLLGMLPKARTRLMAGATHNVSTGMGRD